MAVDGRHDIQLRHDVGIGFQIDLFTRLAPALHEVQHSPGDTVAEHRDQHDEDNAQDQLPIGADIGNLLQAFV